MRSFECGTAHAIARRIHVLIEMMCFMMEEVYPLEVFLNERDVWFKTGMVEKVCRVLPVNILGGEMTWKEIVGHTDKDRATRVVRWDQFSVLCGSRLVAKWHYHLMYCRLLTTTESNKGI